LSYWLQSLNPEQRDAVLHNHGPLLILAGAGSGKTTVLVSRTGRLISEGLAKPERICVLTFTNKAAQELKHRVAKKLGDSAANVWAGTFHGFGLQILKENYEAAGLPRKFGVIDAGDAQSVIKDLLKEHHAYEKQGFVLEKVMQKISVLRETGRESALDDTIESAMAVVLAPKYQKRLRALGVVDFDELLLRPLKMMRESEELRGKLQKRFDFVMVDEFQDTNNTQMLLVDELTAAHRNLAVVGDDDQSIYGWRGAQIRNILDFPKRYKSCAVIRLERNYRSTAKILNMANAIIATNKDRHTKVLKAASGGEGEVPELFTFANEEMEIDAIVNELQTFQKRGYAWKDIAILYRSNSQGGLMEGGLRRTGIPYKITGGTALFDRKEAKDVLAFIRCSIYPNEIAFRRIINLPARGIGEKTIESIEDYDKKKPREFHLKAKLWAQANPHEKASESINQFFQWLEDFKKQLVHAPGDAEEVLQQQLEGLGYRKLVFDSFKDPKAGESRWLAVVILGRILSGMFGRHGRSLETLEKFIDSMELRDREEDDDGDVNQVQMMTLHACKGLEFPLVFLLGLEEDLLPHAKLGQDVDEERRLFYVGVTRAKKHLVMTRVRERKRYGKIQLVAPSRPRDFLDRTSKPYGRPDEKAG
jgi:superfamily I DNA/RNA helicase